MKTLLLVLLLGCTPVAVHHRACRIACGYKPSGIWMKSSPKGCATVAWRETADGLQCVASSVR